MSFTRLVLSALLLSGRLAIMGATPESSIQEVLAQQVNAWNHGDLPQFVAGYDKHCTLVGSSVSETTREQVLAHYLQKYPSAGTRGKLTFADLKVHTVDGTVAFVTGYWHLERTPAFGGPVKGVFSLVFKLVSGNWLIVLDHTS